MYDGNNDDTSKPTHHTHHVVIVFYALVFNIAVSVDHLACGTGFPSRKTRTLR